jgi:ABC-type bacteriocin/lantibiotic exporter with double-glycine peptidase domain
MTFPAQSFPDARLSGRDAQQQLYSHFAGGNEDERLHCCDVGSCIKPLLEAMGWRGEARHLMESLPHFEDVDSIEAVRAVFARLNYETSARQETLANINDAMLPCLFEDHAGKVSVLLERDGTQVRTFDGAHRAEVIVDADGTPGTAYIISEAGLEEEEGRIKEYGWMAVLLRKFRGLIWQLFAITFVINVFALAVPIFIMNVYDKVIGTRSQEVLMYFLLGIAIIVAADVALRAIRARAVAYLGARCETLIGGAAFQQLLNLPINMTERAPIGAQITRIKQFEGVRDIFTGTIASTVLDLPFMVVFLVAIILIGGPVAWVAAVLIALYGIMAAITIPLTKHHVGVTGEARSRLQNFLIEMLSKHRTLRDNRSETVWNQRFRQLIGDSIIRHFRSQQLNLAVQTLSQTFVMGAGVATIWIGTLRVMEGEMTVGALIAVMALIWRVLAPLNSAFLTLNRLGQTVQTIKQVNGLMRLKLERVPGEIPSFYRSFEGAVSLSRVGFRYTARSEPALMGVNAEIGPGQFVAITGPSGAGKSTMLKIAAGLYQPQAGTIQIDGLDLRQIDIGELRHAIAVVPQKVTFFHGTIDQNIRLAHPTASDEDIERACREARLDDYASALPEGRSTRLTSELQHNMPDGLRQRLMLARAFVKDAPILLLDEPANNLDRSGEEGLLKKLESLRGRATVLMVTHRPSHMRLADRVLYLEQGQLIHDAAPEQVLPLIMDPA